MHDDVAVLPQSDAVDVERLARAFTFRSTTQVYKYLFFRSLLDRVASSENLRIALVEILADVIEFAWWPVMHYRLNIGVGRGVHRMRELVECARTRRNDWAEPRSGITPNDSPSSGSAQRWNRESFVNNKNLGRARFRNPDLPHGSSLGVGALIARAQRRQLNLLLAVTASPRR